MSKFDSRDLWYTDCAVTKHICLRRDWFVTFTNVNSNTYKIKIGNGTLVDAIGIGNVQVKVRNTDNSYSVHTIPDVWHSPEIMRNLLSIDRASEKGININLEITF